MLSNNNKKAKKLLPYFQKKKFYLAIQTVKKVKTEVDKLP